MTLSYRPISIGPESDVEVGRGRDEPGADRRPGRDAVGSRQRQVRAEAACRRAPSPRRATRASTDAGEADQLRARRPARRATGPAAVRPTGMPRRRRSRCRTAGSPCRARGSPRPPAPTRSSSVGPRKRSVRWRLSRRTQRTSRPPPGTPSARTRSTTAAISDSASAGTGTATNRRRPGRSAPGQRGATARLGHPGRSPVSRSQTPRSVRRTSSARSRSRQPTTSTLLSSSAL